MMMVATERKFWSPMKCTVYPFNYTEICYHSAVLYSCRDKFNFWIHPRKMCLSYAAYLSCLEGTTGR